MKITSKTILGVAIAFFLLGGCAPQPAPPEKTAPGENGPPATTQLPATALPSGLVLIGETEYVTVVPAKLRLAARIDTGATTSSIGAYDIHPFERDGKKWVRFTVRVPAGGKSAVIKAPVRRTIGVKQHGAPAQKRLVVSLPIVMGPLTARTDFSLADRSTFKYPLLIGRSFLRGRAVVDVNQEYILSAMGDNNDK